MPAPLDPDKRTAIEEDIAGGELSRNAIARKHKVSPGTVTNIGRQLQGDAAFDRTHSVKGAQARSFDAKAARAQLIEDLYGDAQRMRRRIWSEYSTVVSTREGPEILVLNQPPLRDQQAGMTAVAIAIDKATQLERHDDDGGSAAGKTMVNDLFAALGLAYHRVVEEEGPPPDIGGSGAGSA